MLRRALFACAALAIAPLAAADGHAQVSSFPSIMWPVVNDPCTGGRCGDKSAPQPKKRKATREDSLATCARARTITPKPADKAKHDRLMTLCESIGA